MKRMKNAMQNQSEVKQKMRLSSVIIYAAAMIMMIIGVIWLIASFRDNSVDLFGMTKRATGIALIISSSLFFIIANVADDIHYLTVLQEWYADESTKYQANSLETLRSIERLLKDKNGVQPDPLDETQPIEELRQD